MQHRTEFIKLGHLIKVALRSRLEAPINDKKVSEVSVDEGFKIFSSLIALR